jgi:hypothetical protein
MFPVANPAQVRSQSVKVDKGKGKADDNLTDVNEEDDLEGYTPASTQTKGKQSKEVKESECFLTSVLSLREKVKKGRHKSQIISSIDIPRVPY